MRIGIPRESDPTEKRVAMTPEAAAKLCKMGVSVQVEAGLGSGLSWSDDLYREAGATIAPDRAALLRDSDIVLRVRQPAAADIEQLKPGAIHVSFLDPFRGRDSVEVLAAKQVSAFSMEMVPRSSRAQKMDALSSQHSLSGYYMVILAAERLGKVLPMMTTPSGTIQPARVFVIGAGVAGLQAIATARRLGARVEAYDTRAVVEEQVKSLGARWVKIDVGETGQTAQGYATELTAEQQRLQHEGMTRACAQSDIVITTAQLFGRPAPVVITRDMLARMKPGSIVVDYAASSGGNVEGSVPGEEVIVEGVRVIGLLNYPAHVAMDASRMYANNLLNLLLEVWDKETSRFVLDLSDDIISGALLTHEGQIINPVVRKFYGMEGDAV